MKSSKNVETCFVRANNDFDAKLTAFWMKKKRFGQKSPKTDTVFYHIFALSDANTVFHFFWLKFAQAVVPEITYLLLFPNGLKCLKHE